MFAILFFQICIFYLPILYISYTSFLFIQETFHLNHNWCNECKDMSCIDNVNASDEVIECDIWRCLK